jgi:hypothetical protein
MDGSLPASAVVRPEILDGAMAAAALISASAMESSVIVPLVPPETEDAVERVLRPRVVRWAEASAPAIRALPAVVRV